jgi:hypothetical protein
LGFDVPVIVSGGTSGGVTVNWHENVAGCGLALSLRVTVNDADPVEVAFPDTTVLAPVVLLKDNHDGPESDQVYGGVPPDSLSPIETLDWNASGEAGQLPSTVIFSPATVTLQLKIATGAPELSDSVTVNGNVPPIGAVPDTVTLVPVVELNDIHEGPDRLH